MAAAKAWLLSQASAGEEMQVWLGPFAFWCCSPNPKPGSCLLLSVGDSIDVLCDLASVFHISWIQTFANLGDLIKYSLK